MIHLLHQLVKEVMMKRAMKIIEESRKTKKHTLLIVLAILLAVPATAALILMTHTQIIVGTIQKLSAGTVNTANSYEPLSEPMEGIKDNGQYIITEIKYSDHFPNSFLDITYPDEDRETPRPTLIYFHGGGFFGGSKSVGDPLAESDATALLDDICAEGFHLVNIDYVLVPEYHFPSPLIQANEAFAFLMDHADDSNYPDAFLLGSEYYVDMREMDAALTNANVEHALVDPLAERNLQMQHCFVASERVDDVARDAFERMIEFVKNRMKP